MVRALAKRDYRIRVAVRRPDLAGHLQPLGKVGQIHAVQANLRYPDSVGAAVRDAHIVINLVAILAESGAQTFKAVQVDGAAAVAAAAKAAGARLIHVSAIGADENSTAAYARTKAAGEQAVRAAVPDATIFRPSLMFGPEDQFTNRFAALARVMPALPLIGGDTKVQPAFVGDVATAIADAVDGQTRSGATYEVGGPEVLTMREVLDFILKTIERERMLVPLPFGLAKIKAAFLQFAPGALKLTPDQVELLRSGQCGVGCGKGRRPDAGRTGHRSGIARRHRAGISLAFPQDRPVPQQRGVISPKLRKAPHPEEARNAPSRRMRPKVSVASWFEDAALRLLTIEGRI